MLALLHYSDVELYDSRNSFKRNTLVVAVDHTTLLLCESHSREAINLVGDLTPMT